MAADSTVERGLVRMEGPLAPRAMKWSWIAAALVSVSLHCSVAALAWAQFSADADDGGLGANVMEVAVELAAPELPQDDLKAGPGSEASMAAADAAEEKKEVKAGDPPKAVADDASDAPAPGAAEPRAQAPDDKTPLLAEASQAQSESEATSKKSLDDRATLSENLKAPIEGSGRDQKRITANWGRRINAYLELHKRFPPGKIRAGKVGVSFVVDRSGRLVSVDVERSSGDAGFDAAAVSMIQRSDPVPPAPIELRGGEFAFSLDVNFDASDRRSGS